jgi:hypothetical protein
MEKLEDLPVEDSKEMNSEEAKVMEKYFGDASTSKSKSLSWTDSAKLTMCSSFLFIALANPWVDDVLSRLPYCNDGKVSLFTLKIAIFVFLFFIMAKFLL